MKAREIVSGFKTEFQEGFTGAEMTRLCEENNLDYDRFIEMLGVNTGLIRGGEFITYSDDVELGVRCILEDREPNALEWD